MFWKLFSLISVSVSFLLLTIWVYLPRNKSRFDEYRSIPMDDDIESESSESVLEGSL